MHIGSKEIDGPEIWRLYLVALIALMLANKINWSSDIYKTFLFYQSIKFGVNLRVNDGTIIVLYSN